MKTMFFLMMMAGSVVASAAQEVAFNANDSRPLDQRRTQNSGVFAKLIPHNGRTFTVMYEAMEDGNRTLHTRVIGICSVFAQESVQRCLSEPKTAEAAEVYKIVVAQRKKSDCNDIALIHNDNMKSRAAIADFNTKKVGRDNATNQRELAIIMNTINNQTEALGNKTGQNMYNANIHTTRQLLDAVANRRISEQDAIKNMVININILMTNYSDLLSKTQCTNEQLQVCAINKQNGQIMTRGNTTESGEMFDELMRRGIIEIKACSLAPQQPATTAPVIDKPVVNEPQIAPQTETLLPVDPVIQ